LSEAFRCSLYWRYRVRGVYTEAQEECQNSGIYGENFCGGFTGSTKEIFEFFTGDLDWVGPGAPPLNHKWQMIENFLNDIPDGHYIMAYSLLEHRVSSNNPDYAPYQNNVVQILEELGAEGIGDLTKVVDNNGSDLHDRPFILFGRKGDPDFESTYLTAETVNDVLNLDILVAGKVKEGSYETQLIGPSKAWDRLEFDVDQDADEAFDIELYGFNNNFEETFILNSSGSNSVDISWVNAENFPFLKLRAINRDSINFTPPRLNSWKVHMQRAGELALDQNVFLDFQSDTLRSGENISFEMAVTNASSCVFDDVRVEYTFINADNQEIIVGESVTGELTTGTEAPAPLDAFAEGETQNAVFTFPSQELPGGSYFLEVNVNPNREQAEKFNFNNIVRFPFFIINDNINPLVDVTFDGVHILNGDIVSASPEIIVKIKDENAQTALTDSTIADLYLIYPDGTNERVNYSDLEFSPSDPSQLPDLNEAHISLKRDFEESGTYQLKVVGRDMAGNESGSYDYEVDFEVILESLVSNLLNYPNPFTTSTQFIFTLTGREFPDVFKIQVMNISGRVVREFDKSELGNVHIGRNITDFRWDGYDKFGNELANGVYFYRVIVSDADGSEWDKYSNVTTRNLDKLFGKHAIGKMYKVR